MTAPALPVDELPDLLGTSPADLIAAPGQLAADLATVRRRAERIRSGLVSYSQMRQDIADAYAQRDWEWLGYATWYAYLEGEFGQELQQLARSREERQLAVGDLRGQGLSTRQIAAVAGVDAKTVRNDLAAGEPGPATVIGTDGKTYPASHEPAESQWEQVYQQLALFTEAGGWATARAVVDALGDGWTVARVTGRLRALQEGGRVESSTDRSVTGLRGTAWRARLERSASPAMVTVELPAGDVPPDPMNDPAGPVAPADDPPAAATSRDSRPEDRPGPQLPAGRDLQVPVAFSGDGASAAVATTGQPGQIRIAGSDALEVYDHGFIRVGDRDLHLLAGRIDDMVPVAFLAVEQGGAETELLALNALKVQLLIQKLTAIHSWLVGEQLVDDE